MKARLREYRMLWRAAVTHGNSGATRFVGWFVLFAVLVLVAATGEQKGTQTALAALWAMGFAILMLNWAWRFMPGAVKLNHPAHAKLVPRMRRRLVELSCLVCFVGIAGIASAPFPNTKGIGVVLFWVVLVAAGTGLAAAGHRMGSTIIVMAGVCAGFSGKLAGILAGPLSHPLAILLSVPLYAAVIFVAVRAMFPQGGERHWDMEARRKRWADAGSGKHDPFIERVAGVHTKGRYATALRRDGARRDAPRLLLHALGPSHHLNELGVAIGLMAALLAVLGLFTAWRVDAGAVRDIGWMFAAMLLFVPLSHSLRLAELAGGHVAEQGLARLAPAAPATAAGFNRVLGRALLRRALAGWLMASGAALALVALGGADLQGLLRMAGVCCLALPMVALPLRNHAAARPPSGVVSILVLLLCFTVCLAVALGIGRMTGLPTMALAAFLGIAIAAIAAARGLRKMEAAPCAFPAGRMD